MVKLVKINRASKDFPAEAGDILDRHGKGLILFEKSYGTVSICLSARSELIIIC